MHVNMKPFQIAHNAVEDESFCLWVLAPTMFSVRNEISKFAGKEFLQGLEIHDLGNNKYCADPEALDYVTWSRSIAAEVVADIKAKLKESA